MQTPVFHRQVPAVFSYVIIVSVAMLIGAVAYIYYPRVENSTTIVIQDSKEDKKEFVYGSWPALQNAEFFNKTKEDFIAQKATFIEADLSAMIIRFYKDGIPIKEAPIQTKGREGSWWETPAGLYKIDLKAKNLFSSFGGVYMPWSMQFQGNFFIHGWPYYPDGTPVASTYSGGCIRLSYDDAKEFYHLVNVGTPVLVFEKSFNGSGAAVKYKSKNLLPANIAYLAADLENNFVFAENRSGEQRSIASITKLLSALVAVEYINVEREVAIDSSMIVQTSIPRLKAGDRISVLDLLSLMLMESSNEAALAITKPLGESQFINLMNTKAKAIGMTNSNFVDASGVSSDNVSTAEDLFNLAKYLYYNRSFVLHMSLGKENRAAYGPSRYKNLQNFNSMSLTTKARMIGGKVGLSSSAGDSMLGVFELEIDGQKRPIAIIVLGSTDAKDNVKTLLDYIEKNYSLDQ